MLSRVAENLFWMSRYLERAENVARLLDIGLYLELDAPSSAVDDGSAPVEIALDILACREAFRAGHARRPTATPVLGFLTFDRTNPQSILSMIARARENARGTQESLGVDAWSEVNRLYLYLSRPAGPAAVSTPSPSAFYATIKQSCILFDGLIQNTLPRDEVYHFLQLGRYLERVERDGPDPPRQVPEPRPGTGRRRPADASWSAGPACCGAARPTAPTCASSATGSSRSGVIRFLVLEPRLPPRRSASASPAAASRSRRSPAATTTNTASEAERLLGRLDSELRYIDVGEIFERGLLRFLDGIQDDLPPRRRRDPQTYLHFLT